MKGHFWIATLCALALSTLVARGEVQVAVEHIDTASADPGFKFKKVPVPLKNDAAAHGRFSIVDGQSDPNGSSIRRLNDGRLPEEEDSPTENFFFAQGSNGGRLALDLGSAIDVKQVNTYSWHADTRAPQVYTLYASDGSADGFNASPKRDTDPQKCGWKLIAKVDTRPKAGDPGGQYGASISDSAGALGKFRYFLFDIDATEDRDPFGNTFYSEIDVRAMTPTEAEVVAGPQFKQRQKNFEVVIDTSASPQLSDWAEKTLRPQVEKWYPIFVDSLASDGFTAPRKFTITIRPGRGVAATSGTDVTVSTSWIESQLRHTGWNQAAGSVIHELVHVVQQYKARNNPGWLVEGIADYFRWYHYEPLEHRPKLRSRRARYTEGYQTTAGFLEYVVKNYDHEFVIKINAAMREGRYSPELWKEYTGLSLGELWNKYLDSVFGPAAAQKP